MNIFQKLQECRVKLQQANLKKTGCNKFAGYDYYELGDFLPKVNELMKEYNMCSYLQFDKEMVSLTIVDADKPEDKIVFTAPMSSASLKGCHEAQNLGAVISYEKRYLYQNAFEIVECDVLDKTLGKEDKPANKPQFQNVVNITDKQIAYAYSLGKEKGQDEAKVNEWCKGKFKKEIKALTKAEFDALCTALKALKAS